MTEFAEEQPKSSDSPSRGTEMPIFTIVPSDEIVLDPISESGVASIEPIEPSDELDVAGSTLPPSPQKRNELAAWLGMPLDDTVRHVRAIQKQYPELFSNDEDGALLCEPEVARIIFERTNRPTGESQAPKPEAPEVDAIAEAIKQTTDEEARKQRKIKKDFDEFAEEMNAGETLDAQAFKKLIAVLGAESSLDVFYRFLPDARSLPMPIVRSFLSEYLGDVIIRPGTIDWNNLGECLPFFDDVRLQALLGDVIKRACARQYNKTRKENPDEDDFNILADYLAGISAKFEDLKDKNLNKVMNDVNQYFENVFFLEMPKNMVNSLKKGRTFPDLDQKMGVYNAMQEINYLFANAPGKGKSAAAIMVKELRKSSLALILTPSGVINDNVWQDYLSSKVSPTGKQVGYFKPGQEPRVLVVQHPKDLEGISPDDYDYILMASDRVDRDEYFDALKAVDYDMMIVDEAHTFKNIMEGKRAANLIELSQKLEPDESLLMLTATPAPNKVEDIALTLKLMYPAKFRDFTNADLVQTIIRGDLLEIRSLLLPKMQCLTHEDSSILSLAREKLYDIELEGAHRLAYEVILDDWEMEPREKLQVLRQTSLNPAMLEGTPGITSAKIERIHAQIDELFLKHKKIVLFVNGYVTDIIAPNKDPEAEDITILSDLQIPGVRTEVIHGGVSNGNKRRQILEDFRSGRDPMLLVVSGSTVSVGVDLSAADVAIQYNEPWTVSDKSQQYGRAERPGRTGKLDKRTYYFTGTVEEGIHKYIIAKDRAINKLLHGVPLTEAEQALVKSAEKGDEEGFELNPELAKFYYSAIDRMNKMFGMTKEIGEEEFRDFLAANGQRYAKEYARTYQDLTTRSYQANSSRMTGTIIDRLEDERESVELNKKLVILDIGSGPEMLRRHVPEKLVDNVISLDINDEHFKDAKGPTIVGTMRDMKVENDSVDYANMSLVLHYSAWRPKNGNFERLEVLAELNRVLKVGGTGIIAMPYSRDFKDVSALQLMLKKLGFAMVDTYSGAVTSGPHFRSHVITIKKLETVKIADPKAFVMERDPKTKSTLVDSLRFRKNELHLRDQRLMAQSYTFEESKAVLGVQLNATDKAILEEEQSILRAMAGLRSAAKDMSIVNIPVAEILKRGFSRIWNGKKYILFKHLAGGGGAVTYRD